MMKDIINKFYNEKIENICTRILYFFNTIDTYFAVAGILSFLIYTKGFFGPLPFLLYFCLIYLCFKIADFFPIFLFFTPLFLFFLAKLENFSWLILWQLLTLNVFIFVIVQFLFMGIPDSIVARDITIPLRKLYNSIFTIAPTTVSLPMSVYFSSLLSLILYFKPNPIYNRYSAFLLISLFLAAFLTKIFRTKTFTSQEFKPPIKNSFTKRVIMLNIDGCRLDTFKEAKLDFMESLKNKSAYFTNGAITVYRALTNPAFASLLTGVAPEVHGVLDNNLGRRIKVEALPDLIPTILYGSMHVKHFSKPNWNTKIVSLPTHSIYKSDDIMFEMLKEDLTGSASTKLFIADLSEVDFLGHAYGGESKQYFQALKRADKRIADFFRWIQNKDLLSDTTLIICSDHGIYHLDHSYLIFEPEKYVPLIFTGCAIKKGVALEFEISIMDIAPTISYLLGISYPNKCRGRVITEAIS